jgi:hypothetical protein
MLINLGSKMVTEINVHIHVIHSEYNLNQNINGFTGFREILLIKPTCVRANKTAGRGEAIFVLDPQGCKESKMKNECNCLRKEVK